MIELILLKSLISKETYRQYRSYVTVSKELYPILRAVDTAQKETERDPVLEEVAALVALEGGEQGYLQTALDRLRSLEVPKDVGRVLQQAKTQQTASKLALEAYKVSKGEGDVQVLHRLVQELETPVKEELPFVSSNLSEILDATVKTPGLRWRLPWLNQSLGSLRRGDFGFVFTRPEVGKTTLLADQSTYMAGQPSCTGPILWFNNEEQGRKVQLRCYEAALGAKLSQIMARPDEAQRAYRERTGDKIRIIDNPLIKPREIEALCEREKPSLIIFDLIDKVKGFDADREDLHLGAIYRWARELAKSYAPVIGTCHADGTAEGVDYLHMGHVSNAKTAKQGEADFILGIGKSHDTGKEFIRYFNISKNKLIGDSDTDPQRRHGRVEVLLKPEIARYSEM